MLGTATAIIGSAAASAAGGIIGSLASGEDRDRAEQAMAEALAEIEAIGADPSLQQEIILEKLKQVGVYTPELENTVRQEVSKVAQIQEDPTGREAQLKALSRLGGLSETGLGPQERAAFNEMREKAAAEEQSRQQGILQSLAQRGMAGSGAEIATRLASSQATANQERASADRVAASAAERALAALSQFGNLGGTLRDTDFNVQKTKATAEDELNRFNVQNQRDVQMRNIQARNQGQKFNLEEAQRVADQNAALANAEGAANRARARAVYEDKVANSLRKANVKNTEAARADAAADRTAQQWTSAGSAIGSGVAALGQANLASSPKLSADKVAVLTPEQQAELERKAKLGKIS